MSEHPIAIVIPTLDEAKGQATGRLALLSAGCDAELIVSAGPRRGFTLTVNDGIRRTGGNEDVMILNDDVVWFQYGWLAILQRAIYRQDDYGIAGPSGKSNTAPLANGFIGQHGIEPVHHLPFWCALVKRVVFDKIGLLDEEFIHYGSDNWFCEVARRAGYQSIWVRDVYLEHTSHGSGLITEWRVRDQDLLAQRMGRHRR